MSPLWRAAAAAAARRRLGRPPFAETTAMRGRRTMASFSTSAGTDTKEEGGVVRVAILCGLVMLVGIAVSAGPEKRPITKEAHQEEMKSIREQMNKLQASNDEILALLKTDRTRTGE